MLRISLSITDANILSNGTALRKLGARPSPSANPGTPMSSSHTLPSLPRSSSCRGLAALLLLTALAPRPVAAQRERVIVRVETFGSTTATAPAGTTAAEEFTQGALQLQATQRVLLDGGNTMLLVGGVFRQVMVSLPRMGAGPAPEPTALNVATADLWLARTLDDSRTLFVVLRPGLYGDGDDAGAQLRVEGAVFIDKIRSPRTTVGFGLSLASGFGRLLPVPVVHIVARPKRQLLIDALLPARADLWWMPRRGLDIGFGAALVGAQYGLSEERRVDTADRLWLANATVGPQLRWSPRGGKLQITADVGATVLRRVVFARGSREVADLAPGNVGYARLGAQWLF